MWTRGMSYKFLPHWVKDLKGVQHIEKEVFPPFPLFLPTQSPHLLLPQFSIQEVPVTSIICDINNGTPITEWDEEVEIKGIAYSGGGRSIISLGVTPDGGATWLPAELREGKEQVPGQAWAWTFWTCVVPVSEGW